MTLTELKTLVDRAVVSAARVRRDPDEIKVGIRVFNPNAVGGSPLADVSSVQLGFDWDANRCIIFPVTDLIKRPT